MNVREGRFALNMEYVRHQLHRVTAPGCNVCIHIQQLLAYKNQHGFSGRRDFRGAMIDLFTRGGSVAQHLSVDGEPAPIVNPQTWKDTLSTAGGFRYIGEFVIPKDPQAMAQRLNLHSLQFKTGYARNGCNLAPAINDYVLIFQKPGEHPCPPRPLYDERKNPGGWVTTDQWVRWASGVWDDIEEFDILDGARAARESDEEKHVCPLQLSVIQRLVLLYTNPISVQPDVRVLDPFMGIGSTAYVCLGGPSPMTKDAVPAPRSAVGFELKESYYANSLRNVDRARQRAARRDAAPELFVAGARS